MKYLFIALFISPLISYSQQDSTKQIIGKIYTKVSGPYYASVILHRNKQAIVVIQTTGDSLQQIFNSIERERSKLGKEVVATYEHITYQKPGSKKLELDVTPYNQKDLDPKSNITQEINKLREFNFISGTIYFSGNGFTNVSSANVNEKEKLETYYLRSRFGTTIVLDKCVYRTSNGSLSAPLNKSIMLN
jgi:hypothetical protein